MKTASRRIRSLDVFRGLTIAGMILVNCPGNDGPYRFLAHAQWNGCTFADLIFPAFLVIMGISVSLSLGRRLQTGTERAHTLGQAFRRAAAIFFLGVVVSLVMMPQLGVFRLPGVLQRISVCYFVCAALFLYATPHGQAVAAGTLLLGYWLLLTTIPAPGRAPGDLSPDGNLASYVDRLYFGTNMFAETHDPEGILSTLPAIATSLIGLLAGQWLAGRHGPRDQARGLLLRGLFAVVVGLLWSAWFPLNKNLWTSSYALFSGGLALFGFAVCHYLTEAEHLRAWGRPFEILGRNALASYFLSELFYGLQEFIRLPASALDLKEWFTRALFGRLSQPNAALAYSLCYLTFCVLVMREFDRREIYIKV